MITAEKILIGNIPYENVQIFTHKEQAGLKIENYFEDAQMGIKCKEGTFIVPSYKITMILLKRRITKLRPNVARQVKRLVVGGECSYSPAYIVKPGKHAEAGIPPIFKQYEQFAFACIEGLYVTTDFNVVGMEL